MTGLSIGLVAVLALTIGAFAARHRSRRARQPTNRPSGATRTIVFPFVATALSQRALDAALRLARAEDATLMPVFLARVPLHLPLDAALPRQSTIAITLQDAIEQRATAFGVPVDARIERGRTHRHALRQTIANERFDRMVVAAAANNSPGFIPDDVAWLLANAPGEIVVLRPSAREEPWVEPAQRPNRRPAFVGWGDSHSPAGKRTKRDLQRQYWDVSPVSRRLRAMSGVGAPRRSRRGRASTERPVSRADGRAAWRRSRRSVP